jgi:hypothetical protein
VIETREQLERPGVLRRAVAELGARAADRGVEVPSGIPTEVEALRDLAGPDVLDLLFRLALESSLRRGPGGAAEVGSPARLVALAASAAAAGVLPLRNVVALRDSLVSLAAKLHRSGAWEKAVPLWWEPLPEPGPLEAAWRALDGEDGLRLAGRNGGREPLAEAGWIVRREVLGGEVRRRTAAELDPPDGPDGPHGESGLDLRRAGVGYDGRSSARRSDEVRYVTGLEPDLLARAPTLAVLAQRILDEVEEALAGVVPEGCGFAPQTCMLACYRAPSHGFAAHLDNPGGDDDNRRTYALVLYLNPPGRECAGGNLSLWTPGASTEELPAAVLPPAGGTAVLFDARRVPHAVEPLGAGADRWTLVLWLSDRRRRPPRPLLPVPEPSPAAVLLPLDDPPVAPGTVVFRKAEAASSGPGPLSTGESPEIVRVPLRDVMERPRIGFVTTVRRPGPALSAWCRHHLELGADHLLVVLDSGDEEGGTYHEEGGTYHGGAPGDERVTVWSRAEARRRWGELAGAPADELERLRSYADRGDRATWAVAARQALNASAALAAVRSGELGAEGQPLDWLVHLDGDELFHLEGAGRGGGSLAEHFSAAGAAGWSVLRYLNHELLLPWSPGEPARFKRNPAVAAVRLGPVGWARLARHLGMEQEGRRPYFRAYWNGKGAVSVAAGGWAPGVHGWRTAEATENGRAARPEVLLAGPSILHYHLPDASAFRDKYREAAGGPDAPDRPFPPSRLERAAAALLRKAGEGAADLDERLERLYRELTVFEPAEVEMLDAAGLLFTPRVAHPPLPSAHL